MYGFNVRVPQLTLDARYGLGRGWSLKGHLNSMFVTTELLLGGSYAWRAGDWSFEGSASAGIYVGQLAQVGFDATLLAPEYRPELTLGYDLGDIALSLRGSLLLMGPEQRARRRRLGRARQFEPVRRAQRDAVRREHDALELRLVLRARGDDDARVLRALAAVSRFTGAFHLPANRGWL